MGLLVAGDPEPAIVDNEGAASPLVIVCDHAGHATPQRLGGLGLSASDFERHIAYDIGAGAISLLLGEAHDACVVRQAYSRLVVDCNRAPDRADLIVETADGSRIAGNIGLSAKARSARIAAVHEPYHARIAAILDRRAALDLPTAIVAVHSFTPVLNGEARPWEVGVLHMADSALSRDMLARLVEAPGLVVGDNQPYVMDDVDYTVPRHAQARGLDYLELEIRQDLIADPDGRRRIADLLARLLKASLAEAGLA